MASRAPAKAPAKASTGLSMDTFLKRIKTSAAVKRSFTSNAGQPPEVKIRSKFIAGLEHQIELIEKEQAGESWQKTDASKRDPRWYYAHGGEFIAGGKYGVREVPIGNGKMVLDSLAEVADAYTQLIELTREGHLDDILMPIAEEMSKARSGAKSKK